MSPSPIDRELAAFVASKDHATRFPIKTVKVIEGKPAGVEEVSVFLVRDPVLIELLTLTISKHVEEFCSLCKEKPQDRSCDACGRGVCYGCTDRRYEETICNECSDPSDHK